MQYMQKEFCILVDEQDNDKGHESKEFCHLIPNIEKGVALHRAFSVFLFNSEGKLLLQQRAHSKITFPLYWTNTCCSHPIYNFENERPNAKDTLGADLGVKVAAVRKLEHELGMPQSSFNSGDFTFMTRILYKAPFDDKWGEHEVDYCLMYQCKVEDEQASKFPLNKLNYDEVEDAKFVTQDELRAMMNDSKLLFTPWFKLIVNKFLWKWWDSMMQGKLNDHVDTATIHSM